MSKHSAQPTKIRATGAGISSTKLTRRPRRGNGVLEAALVLPVLLFLSMGMVEFGQFFYAKHTIQAAARDGCRTAILPTSTHSQATSAVSNTMSAAGYIPSKYSVSFQNPTNNATISDVSTVTKGNGIRVTVTANYGNVGLRPLGVIAANKQVIGITTMVKE